MERQAEVEPGSEMREKGVVDPAAGQLGVCERKKISMEW
jgi:hypothetical protein